MDVSQLYSYLLMVLFLMLSLNLVYICVAAIAVVLENMPEGSNSAVNCAKEVFDEYFN